MTRFNQGDVVRAVQDSIGGGFRKGNTYTVRRDCRPGDTVMIERDERGSRTNGWGEQFFELASPAPVSKGWIVIARKDGKFLPAIEPRVYVSLEQATKVARKLARSNPGEEFVVFASVSSSTVPPAPEVNTINFA